jgi:TonB family protein
MRVIAQLLLNFLLNASWQVALIVACAWLGDRMLRGLARYRHALWAITLVSSLVLPLLACSSLVRKELEAKETNTSLAARPIVISTIVSSEVEEIQAAETPASSVPSVAARHSILRTPIHVARSIAVGALALYVLLLLWRTANLFRAWRRTRALVKSAYEYPFPERVQTLIQKCQSAIGAKRARILCATDTPVPITIGLINPVVIMPERLLHEGDDELLTSAIGHELVHVARRDYLTNLIYEFIYVPLSFHPAAALARRRIKQTRELCCDESVATRLLRRDVYARSLVRLIGATPLPRRLAADTTIGINESDILEVRIMTLLKTPNLNSRGRRFLLIAASFLLATPCVAAAKLALSFEIGQQEPASSSWSQQNEQSKQDRQQRMREDLERQALELRKQMREAPQSQRADIEAKLREVQRVLKEHEQMLRQSQDEKRLKELKEALDQTEKNAPVDEARLKEVREQIAAMEKLYTPARMRELKETLAQMEKNQPADEARLREEQQRIAEMQKSQTDRKAKLIYKVEPEYPADAREKKIEGTVRLGFTIDHDGVPQNVVVKQSLYPSLDQAAIDAVHKWRFEPAIKDGQPVSMTVMVDVYFSSESSKQDLERKEKELREKAEMEERAARGELDGQQSESRARRQREEREREEKLRGAGLAAAKWAKISMAQAIQIATSKYPGTVLQCRLLGEREDKVFYQVLIANVEGEKSTIKYVWVSAIDGSILKTEEETKPPVEGGRLIEGGRLNGKAVNLPKPDYPATARAANAEGLVEVRITIDEEGNVVAAKAVSGHPLLQAAAVSAAREAKFTPTRIDGQPVRVTGLITYNFLAH